MSTASGRPHLSIGEVLSLLQEEFPDVTISKIRFLESQGLLDPERTPSGYRKFYDGDIRRLRWILRQQKEHFLPLKVIRERLEKGDVDDDPPTSPPTLQVVVDGATVQPDDAGPTAPSGSADGTGAAAPAPHQDEPPRAPAGGWGELPVTQPSEAAQPTQDVTAAGGDADARSGGPSQTGSLLDGGTTAVSLTLEELIGATGLTARQVEELESFGLLSSHRLGDTRLYDEEALLVGRIAASFMRLGVEARHLRMYKVAAEREAGVYEQLVLPRLRSRTAAGRQEAMAVLDEVAELGDQIHGALLRRSLRESLRP